MITSSSSVVLPCPTIPIQDQAKITRSTWTTLAAGPLSTTVSTTTSTRNKRETLCPAPMSNVCPYPRRGISCCSTDSTTSPAHLSSSSSSSSTNPFPSGAGNMDNSSLDLDRISSTWNKLEASGWYHGQLSWQQATNKLKSTPVGTFLIRDSSDPMYLFALSVQTERGPTSIRIHYSNGQFKLDAEALLAGNMPLFDCVVKLVDYYVKLSQTEKAKAHVWLDITGRRDRQIQLSRPLYHQVPQLQHLCRLVLNGQVPIQRINELNLPKSIQSFIKDYPYQR